MTTEYLCNLVVPGAAKSGTSSLHEALNQHNKICMSVNKEPHYVCRAEEYSKGMDFHNNLFSPEGDASVFGESSTGYMIWPETIDRISRDLKNPKIILLLRHPVSRTVSHWKWRVKLGLEVRPLWQAIEVDGYGFHPERPDRYGYMAYLQFSKYSKYCPLWTERFGSENCLMITQDDLSSDFQSTMSRCFSFLNLESFTFAEGVKVNETKNLVGRPKPFMTKAMSLLSPGFKKAPLYRNLRDSILRMCTTDMPTEVSGNEIGFLERVLKDDIEYFNSIEN